MHAAADDLAGGGAPGGHRSGGRGYGLAEEVCGGRPGGSAFKSMIHIDAAASATSAAYATIFFHRGQGRVTFLFSEWADFGIDSISSGSRRACLPRVRRRARRMTMEIRRASSPATQIHPKLNRYRLEPLGFYLRSAIMPPGISSFGRRCIRRTSYRRTPCPAALPVRCLR